MTSQMNIDDLHYRQLLSQQNAETMGSSTQYTSSKPSTGMYQARPAQKQTNPIAKKTKQTKINGISTTNSQNSKNAMRKHPIDNNNSKSMASYNANPLLKRKTSFTPSTALLSHNKIGGTQTKN